MTCTWLGRMKHFLEKSYDSRRKLMEDFRDYVMPQTVCGCHGLRTKPCLQVHVHSLKTIMSDVIPNYVWQSKPDVSTFCVRMYHERFHRSIQQYYDRLVLTNCHNVEACTHLITLREFLATNFETKIDLMDFFLSRVIPPKICPCIRTKHWGWKNKKHLMTRQDVSDIIEYEMQRVPKQRYTKYLGRTSLQSAK